MMLAHHTFGVQDLHGEAEAICRSHVTDNDVNVISLQLDGLAFLWCLDSLFSFFIVVSPDLNVNLSDSRH